MSGSHHFYRCKDWPLKGSHVVSMPYVGLTSFLRRQEILYDQLRKCVNALCRAHIISTLTGDTASMVIQCQVSMPYVGLTSFLPYPFKTSVFMRLSEPVFARIFLNCQIIGYNKNKNWAEYKLYLKNTITDVLRYNHYTLLMTLINC